MQFCSVCKRHYPYGTATEREAFKASGHDARPVSRLKRDLGRKQS